MIDSIGKSCEAVDAGSERSLVKLAGRFHQRRDLSRRLSVSELFMRLQE